MARSLRLLAILLLAACSVKPVSLPSNEAADAGAPDLGAPPDTALAFDLAIAETAADVAADANATFDLAVSPDAATAPDVAPPLSRADRRIPPDLLPDPIEPEPRPDAAAPPPDLALDVAALDVA